MFIFLRPPLLLILFVDLGGDGAVNVVVWPLLVVSDNIIFSCGQ